MIILPSSRPPDKGPAPNHLRTLITAAIILGLVALAIGGIRINVYGPIRVHIVGR